MPEVKCVVCGAVIPAERIELLPNTRHCVKCTDQHGPKVTYDAEAICAKANTPTRNGFGSSD